MAKKANPFTKPSDSESDSESESSESSSSSSEDNPLAEWADRNKKK